MSDQEQEAKTSALGKRARDGETDGDTTMEPPAKSTDNGHGNGGAANEDSDEDDVGPMPMPDTGAAVGGVKKKRKGVSLLWNMGFPCQQRY